MTFKKLITISLLLSIPMFVGSCKHDPPVSPASATEEESGDDNGGDHGGDDGKNISTNAAANSTNTVHLKDASVND